MDNFKYEKTEQCFNYILNTLKDSIKGWDYFVNWDKALNNVKDVEKQLNLLNYLIGKPEDTLEEEFKYLLREYPNVIKAIPVLVACRENEFMIAKINEEQDLKFELEEYSFKKTKDLNEEEINKAVEFAKESGILKLFVDKSIKNLVDYVLGIEVGLDSNGRKNRSGTAMESIVEKHLNKVCIENKYEYLSQATPSKIAAKWNLNVKVDKANRIFDFALKTPNQLYLLETNFYGGGGSKLKSTAGEYVKLQQMVTDSGFELIWVTDGKGWLTASKPLFDTFNNNSYIINLHLLEEGILEDIVE